MSNQATFGGIQNMIEEARKHGAKVDEIVMSPSTFAEMVHSIYKDFPILGFSSLPIILDKECAFGRVYTRARGEK